MDFVQWSQPVQFDNGQYPSVAINDNGFTVEVHQSPLSTLWLRTGRYNVNGFNWTEAGELGWAAGGMTPGIDLSTTHGVLVYNSSTAQGTLNIVVGSLQGEALSWQTPTQYTTGQMPDVAVNNHGTVVGIHQSQDRSAMCYLVGGIVGGQVNFGGSQRWIEGDTPKISLNDNNDVAIAYLSNGKVCCAGGKVNQGAITLGAPVTLDVGSSVDVALDNDGNAVIAYLNNGQAMYATGSVTNGAFRVECPGTFFDFTSTLTLAMNNLGNLVEEHLTSALLNTGSLWSRAGQAALGQDCSRWMAENAASLGDLPLRSLAIPGTHDSGTYAITSSSTVSPDNQHSLLSSLSPEVATAWARSQPATPSADASGIFGQLTGGIRYLDLRICYQQANNQFWLVHGFYGIQLLEALHQVQDFLRANPREVVLLDMNHFYSDQTADASMPASTFVQLAQLINTTIGSNLISPADFGPDVTLNQLWANNQGNQQKGRPNQNLILFFDDPTTVDNNPAYWPNTGSKNPAIQSPWPNTQTLGDLESALKKELSSLPAPQFFVLQVICTEPWTTITQGLSPQRPSSLQQWEATICGPALFWLANQPELIHANIIMTDWFVETLVVPLCMSLNAQKARAARTPLAPAA